MKKHHDESRDEGKGSALGSMKANFAVLAFGLATLLYLVAIDHEEWFHIRPISGVAMALSQASDGGERSPEARP